MNDWQEQLVRETSPAALFPQPPLIRFAPESRSCTCGGQLKVLKTRKKTVFSLAGPYHAHETVTWCVDCGRTFGSEALSRLVPARCQVGYDLLVYVGQALFQRHRHIQEIRAELATRNLHLCTSEISHLGRKFIAFLAMAHRQAAPRVRQVMDGNGGYILHLDATHEGDAPALMTGMDGLSRFILANVKLPSEHADTIIPFLERIKAAYGVPQACVHDMGKGIIKAVSVVFPGIHDFICHFHFLRDIGKDFLEKVYSELRQCLRHHGASTALHALVRETKQYLIKKGTDIAVVAKSVKDTIPPEDKDLLPYITAYSLALWCLHGKASGNGYGFPFDRPLLTFAERLLTLSGRLPDFANYSSNTRLRDNPLLRLQQIISAVTEDQALLKAVKELRWRAKVFDRLRLAMRIALPEGNKGLNDDGSLETMSTIRQGVMQFRGDLDTDKRLSTDSLAQKMAKQIDQYGKKLFADPIEVTANNGSTIVLYPQRTNNILEQFFRNLRRGYRRKTGNNSLSKTLQTMLADTPLVKNLDNPAYVEVLLDGETNLANRFASLQSEMTASSNGQPADVDRILPGFRRLLKSPSLLDQVASLLSATCDAA